MTQLPAFYCKQLFQQIKILVYSCGVCASILHNLHSPHTHIYSSPAFINLHSAKSIGKLYYGRGTTCFNGGKGLWFSVLIHHACMFCWQHSEVPARIIPFFSKICASLQKLVNSGIKGFLNYIERVLAGVNKFRFFYIISSTSFKWSQIGNPAHSTLGRLLGHSELTQTYHLQLTSDNSIETWGTCPYNSNHISLHNFSQEVEWSVGWLPIGTPRRLII